MRSLYSAMVCAACCVSRSRVSRSIFWSRQFSLNLSQAPDDTAKVALGLACATLRACENRHKGTAMLQCRARSTTTRSIDQEMSAPTTRAGVPGSGPPHVRSHSLHSESTKCSGIAGAPKYNCGLRGLPSTRHVQGVGEL